MHNLKGYVLLLCFGLGACESEEIRRDVPICRGSVTVEDGSEVCDREHFPEGEFSLEQEEWVSKLTPLRVRRLMEFERGGQLAPRWEDVKRVGLVGISRCEGIRRKECQNPLPWKIPLALGEDLTVWFSVRTPMHAKKIAIASHWFQVVDGEEVLQYTQWSTIPTASTSYRLWKTWEPTGAGDWILRIQHGEELPYLIESKFSVSP